MLSYMLANISRHHLTTYLSAGILFASVTLSAGCSSSDDGGTGSGGPTNQEGEAPLSDLDDLVDGAPSKADLPEEGKSDAVYPDTFFDLVSLQSPVKSQGSRGVCSIFANVAYMEHLYIAEGTVTNPDFSEQFLQWSVKNEVKAFRDTEGSNAERNLEAIFRFGIVEEGDWPYQSTKWNSSNDPACNGSENLPTKCYTNGDPPEAAMSAKRWHLPSGRWINSSPRSIKGHMHTKKQAVVVGGTFFYQSWNHRASSLPTNNEYWRKGYVTYPNEVDKQKSLEKRAGHGFLLVGWDDTLEVQKRDGEGKLLTDDAGNPVTEKGFFIFKNSWGRGSFGASNPHGDGFGYISYDYVSEYMTAYVSGLPEVESPDEVCNDEKDNDRDGDADCDDSDCAADAACVGSTLSYTNDQGGDIPDNSPSGLESTIEVTDTGKISAVSVAVDISHSYSGDLTVKLVRGSTEVVLQNQQGGSDDGIKKTFAVTEFNGQDAAGTWKLVVIDNANLDTGKLNSWTLGLTTCVGADCGSTATYSSSESSAIPDGDAAGTFTNIAVSDEGEIKALTVNVDITHPEQMDLTIKLQRVGVPGEVILQAAASVDGPYVARAYNVADYLGQDAAGTWRLTVIDEAAGDAGTLNGWSLEIGR